MRLKQNDNCFCGSGKKYKDCCFPKKPRINLRTIHLTDEKLKKHSSDKNLDIDLYVDGINDTARIVDSKSKETIAETENYITRGYFGDKRFKTIYQIPINKKSCPSCELEIFQIFNSIIAIDTNRLSVRNKPFYLGVAFQFKYLNDSEMPIQPYLIKLFDLDINTERPENCNWYRLIDFIKNHKIYNSKQKIGLIVDSDLGEIVNYNNRLKPIYKDYFLPDNFTLIYATSDKKDSLLNLMIKLCDNFLKLFSENINKIQ